MSWVKHVVGSRPFQKTVGVVAAEYLRLVWTTTRLVIEPEGIYERFDRDAPVIIAMWHGQHFLAPFIRRAHDRGKVLVSRHRDGEINALAVERLGIGAIRGSGNHGGGFVGKGGVSAFKEMLSALEEGYNVALTADIPKIARVAGLGVVKLASASGRPIYPIAIATPLAPVLMSHRLKSGKELAARLNERYGESDVARPLGPLVWVHGASVGELVSVIPLIERISEKGLAVLCTSGTVTSANLAEQRLPKGVIHQFVILDTPRFVKRFFDHWQPDLALFVESDLWPNLIMTNAERGVPLILINGRVSERSFNRWRRVPATIAALLRCFDLCLAQSAAHAARYRELGAPHVTTTGNLKFDVPEPPADPAGLAVLRTAVGGRTVIAGASTHAGEETMLIEAHRRLRWSFPRLLTVVAPRHPDRGAAILEIAHAAGLEAALRSRGELPRADTDVYVADTLGELGLIYRLAPIVFVGGSLATHGGQNSIEPIKTGAAGPCGARPLDTPGNVS